MERSNIKRVIECPFCGHKNVVRPHINVLCPCGAKYYISDNTFWDRKYGKIVKNPPFELVEDTDEKQ